MQRILECSDALKDDLMEMCRVCTVFRETRFSADRLAARYACYKRRLHIILDAHAGGVLDDACMYV